MSNTRTTRSRKPAAKQPPSEPEPLYVEFEGSKYKVSDKVGVWPLMQFARAAEAGTSLLESRGLAALHAFIQDIIDPSEWGRFQEDMLVKKVNDLDALMRMAQQAVELVQKRNADTAAAANGTPAVQLVPEDPAGAAEPAV